MPLRGKGLAGLGDATVAVVGAGRLGTALSTRLREAGVTVLGPLGRATGIRADLADATIALLCVPDRAIAGAAATIPPGLLVGHCSGATGLDALSPHEGFSLHPLMTVTDARSTLAGASAAIDGSTERALSIASSLAETIGLTPVRVESGKRALYHAAASTASNYLTTVLSIAEQLAGAAGVERKHLAPLARATVDAWERDGVSALTGPIARGDDATVAAQRAAVAASNPELLETWDALADATRDVASR